MDRYLADNTPYYLAMATCHTILHCQCIEPRSTKRNYGTQDLMRLGQFDSWLHMISMGCICREDDADNGCPIGPAGAPPHSRPGESGGAREQEDSNPIKCWSNNYVARLGALWLTVLHTSHILTTSSSAARGTQFLLNPGPCSRLAPLS